MSGWSVLAPVAGILLVFFVPGYAVSKALFPEWRVRGADGLRRLVELLTLSFVLSVVLTVLVGYALLTIGPSGFQAYWSEPVLEAALAGVAAVAAVLGILRGAYARQAPVGPPASPSPSDSGAFELTRRLDELGREERRIRDSLRSARQDPGERRRLSDRLEEIRAERDDLARKREAEYAE